MSEALAHVKPSQLDGTSQGPRLRQKQLIQIHSAIVAETATLRTALRKDLEYTEAEADLEIFLSSSDARKHYESLSFDKELEEEYLVAHGKDNITRRTAAGIVYLEQSEHSPLYSVIAPLTAAILAGNCVIVELLEKDLSINIIIRKILSASIKNEIVAITSSKPEDTESLSECILVSQDTSDEYSKAQSWSRQIRLHPGRAVAIVDRTANIEQAAQAIVNASFSFRGRSPYSPHLVLVNEFVEESFTRAALHYSSMFLARTPYSRKDGKSAHVDRELKGGAKSRDVEIVQSGSTASILKLKSRKSTLINLEINDPIILIHKISSLDDAIDVLNKSDPLLASYLFCTPANAKYLSQFINSHFSSVNHIPTEILIGPAAPEDHPLSLEPRYLRHMFTLPSSVLLHSTSSSQFLQSILLSHSKDNSNTSLTAKIRSKTATPLKPIGQKPGGSIGFFEQGIMIGGVIYLSLIIGAVVGVSKYGIIPAVQHYRKQT